MSMHHYDYFVIGAGSAGVRSSRIASGYGAKVGIAEGAALGGTCVNLGCVPKKLLTYGADYGAEFENARGFGWSAENIGFDWQTLIKNKTKEIERLNEIYDSVLAKAGVDLFRGYAHFVDANTIEVAGETIQAKHILIAVGGKPRALNIPGADYLASSDDVFFWPRQPRKVVIIGGGYIAVEFAHILRGTGADVSLVYRGDLFLRGFDDDLRTHLADEMTKAGIKLLFNADLASVQKKDDHFIVTLQDGQTLDCDLALSAVGRTPNLERLRIDAAGVKLDQNGMISVNADYQTNIPHIYAVGDVTATPHLTPVAIKEGHVLADRLFGGQKGRSVNYDNLATVVFSAPPIGTIGLSEEAAKAKGMDIQVFKTSFRPMKYSLSGRDEKTLMKLIVDKATDRVIGCHMIGLDAPEIMQGFAVAMNAGATKADFDNTMPIHPTSAEEFVTLR